MALDLSLKKGQWPERTESVITSTHSPYLEVHRKSYQLQQNHHHLLETEKGFYHNNLSVSGSVVPISLVTPKNERNHSRSPEVVISSHRDFRDTRDHPPRQNHAQIHRNNHRDGVIKSSRNTNGIFVNPNPSRLPLPQHHNGYMNVKSRVSPIHDNEDDDGELQIVEERIPAPRPGSRRPRSASPSPPPPPLRGVKRILVEEENNDTSRSQLSLSSSSSPTFAHSTSNLMRIRHPKKANIFLHQEELKQQNLNNTINNGHTSNNNHDIDIILAASNPTRSSTNNNDHHQSHRFQVDVSTHSNNVTSVQPCDSSSALITSRINNLISSTTSRSPPSTSASPPAQTPTPSSNGAADKTKKVEMKFTCTHCTKNFKKQSLLDAHMRLMTEKAKWKSFQKKKYIKAGPSPAPIPPAPVSTPTTPTPGNPNCNGSASVSPNRTDSNSTSTFLIPPPPPPVASSSTTSNINGSK